MFEKSILGNLKRIIITLLEALNLDFGEYVQLHEAEIYQVSRIDKLALANTLKLPY